jgi:hypothetical protein
MNVHYAVESPAIRALGVAIHLDAPAALDPTACSA